MTYVCTVAKRMEIVQEQVARKYQDAGEDDIFDDHGACLALQRWLSAKGHEVGTVLAQASLLATAREAVAAATAVPRPGASSDRSKDTRTEKVGKSALDALPRHQDSPPRAERVFCFKVQEASRLSILDGSGRCGPVPPPAESFDRRCQLCWPTPETRPFGPKKLTSDT